jgi:DNA-binding response OmpR family regulator
LLLDGDLRLADGAVQKPFDLADLLGRIRNLANASRPSTWQLPG